MKLRDDELGGCGICHVDSTIETAKSREKATRKTVSGFSLYLGCHRRKKSPPKHCVSFKGFWCFFVMQHHVFCFVDMFVCVFCWNAKMWMCLLNVLTPKDKLVTKGPVQSNTAELCHLLYIDGMKHQRPKVWSQHHPFWWATILTRIPTLSFSLLPFKAMELADPPLKLLFSLYINIENPKNKTHPQDHMFVLMLGW